MTYTIATTILQVAQWLKDGLHVEFQSDSTDTGWLNLNVCGAFGVHGGMYVY